MPPFRCRPLSASDDIRPISPKGGKPDDGLASQIIAASLGDDIQYSTLSYAWESDEKTYTLLTTESEISNTKSLNSALKHFWPYVDIVI